MSTDKFSDSVSKALQIAVQSLIGIALLIAGVVCALAQDAHSQMPTLHQELTTEQKSQASALLKIVRGSTEAFKDVSVVETEGYALQFGCVGGLDSGAMGPRYINGAIVGRGESYPTHPRFEIHEPTANGGLQLIGADFLVFADKWDKKNQGPPELIRQLFHYWESPNRFPASSSAAKPVSRGSSDVGGFAIGFWMKPHEY